MNNKREEDFYFMDNQNPIDIKKERKTDRRPKRTNGEGELYFGLNS